jgi:hypothetical protein
VYKNGTSTFGGNILASTGSINIGSVGTRFGIIYTDNLDATNISGVIVTGSTSSNDWTVNSDNVTADTENMSLAFERGTQTPNALLSWDATNKKFTLNAPLELVSTIGTASINAVGINSGSGLIQGTGGLTITGTISLPNSSITNAMLANSTISGISLGSNLATLTFGTHLTGTSYNGSTAATIATDATDANTASTIVARDASGNFSAGTITASLTGHSSLDLPLAGGTMTGGITNSTSSNPLTTLAESWIGPSSTAGIYFKGGNVGVGTTGPATKLDVFGNGIFGTLISARGNNQGTISLQNIGNTETSIHLWQSGVASGVFGFKANDSNLYIVNSYTTGSINDTTGMAIDRDGNVGIGTTNPQVLLQVGATTTDGTNVDGIIRLAGRNSGGGVRSWDIGTSGTSYPYSFKIQDNNSASPAFLIDTSGNVGIGATNPEAKLEISAPAAYALSLYRPYNGSNFGVIQEFALNNSNDTRVAYSDIIGGISGSGNTAGSENGTLLFRTKKAGTMTAAIKIDENGNVGIGTTNPGAKLDTALAGGLIYRAYYGSGNNRSLDINVDGSNGDASLTFNTTYNSGWKYFLNNYASRITSGDGLVFQVAPTGTAGATIPWVNALSITSSTGAATFSSTITATRLFLTGDETSNLGELDLTNTATNGNAWRIGDGIALANGNFTIYNTTTPGVAMGINGGTKNVTFYGNVSAPTFQSSVTTGTAPFTVASSTAVTNLNADMVDGVHSYLIPYGTNTSASTSANGVDVNTYWKAGFYSGYGVTNGPGTGDMGFLSFPSWGAADNTNRSSIQIGGSYQSNELKFRSTNNSGVGTWNTIYHSGNLTNTLSSNYLPKWNGSSLANSMFLSDTQFGRLSSGVDGNSELTFENGNHRGYIGKETVNGNYTFGTVLPAYSFVISNYGETSPIVLGHTNAEVYILNGGDTQIKSATASTSSTTGALIIGGGVGVAGNGVFGSGPSANIGIGTIDYGGSDGTQRVTGISSRETTGGGTLDLKAMDWWTGGSLVTLLSLDGHQRTVIVKATQNTNNVCC